MHEEAAAAKAPTKERQLEPKTQAECEDLQARAEAGEADAQSKLGEMCAYGRGVTQDDQNAVSWYQLAAKQGHGGAQIALAKHYEEGLGVPQDDLRACMWANVAAAHVPKSLRDEAVAVLGRVANRFSPQKRLEAQDLARQFLAGLAPIKGGSSNTPKSPDQPVPPTRTTILKEVRTAVWRRDEGQCVECGSKENLEFDHIIPVSKGGSNTQRNIQLLCESCNRSKGASI